jgi:hypothetical protein
MFRYAVVNADNLVVNVIIWDGESRWSPPSGCFVVRSDACDVGQIYDPVAETFSYPAE